MVFSTTLTKEQIEAAEKLRPQDFSIVNKVNERNEMIKRLQVALYEASVFPNEKEYQLKYKKQIKETGDYLKGKTKFRAL